nr:O-antigen ligase family protein [uncultured Marinifilum sp.]
MKYIKIGFLFLIFFIAFYLKSFTIGGFELVYVWKLPLLFYLIYQLVGQETKYAFLVLGYAFAIKNIINVSFFDFPLDTFINFIKYMSIPLFAHWILLNINSLKSLQILRIVPVYLSVFFIISNVPFYLGIISAPVQTMMWLEDFQIDGLIGILGAAHYSSVVLAVSSVILLEFLMKKRASGLVNLLVIFVLLLGLFFLFKTYARTGWLMFVLGSFVLFIRNISFKNMGKIAIVSMVLIGGLFFLFQTNEGFRRRVLDERAGQEEQSTYETVGSGRLKIAEIYLENLYESNFLTYLIGMGMEESILRFEKKDGTPLFAHNGFIQTLVDNGLIGFALYLMFLILIYQAISKSESSHNQLAVAIFFMFISCLATQQANYFLLDVFLSVYIGIVLIEDRINLHVYYQKKSKLN